MQRFLEMYRRGQLCQPLTPHERAIIKTAELFVLGQILAFALTLAQAVQAHQAIDWNAEIRNAIVGTVMAAMGGIVKYVKAHGDIQLADLLDEMANIAQDQLIAHVKQAHKPTPPPPSAAAALETVHALSVPAVTPAKPHAPTLADAPGISTIATTVIPSVPGGPPPPPLTPAWLLDQSAPVQERLTMPSLQAVQKGMTDPNATVPVPALTTQPLSPDDLAGLGEAASPHVVSAAEVD
jgi:hypothetical protein